MKLILLTTAIFSISFTQEHIEELIQHVLHGVRDSAALSLPTIEQEYPNNASVMFLKGLLETDGEKAMEIFSKLYNSHPTSKYGDDAVMKVAEYYYASGLYVQSAVWLKKMPLYYSQSEHIERAVKLFLNSLIVSGHRDTAIFYSRVFKKQFPYLDVDGKINKLLADYKNSKKSSNISIQSNPAIPSSSIEKQINEKSEGYSLQSGAFSLEKNAKNQRTYLLKEGYSARIVEFYRTKILYMVRIGYYNTPQEAEVVRNRIKSILDIDTIIIQNK